MRAIITCLLAAATLAAQNPALRQPSDCAADGTVVNKLTGQALARATVTPSPANGSGASTDAEGKWTISNVSCGPVAFTAQKDGYIQNSYGRSASLPPGSGGARTVTLTSGSAAHGLKIELMPESDVTGRVLDEVGDPVSGAQVTITRSVVQNGRRATEIFGSGGADNTGTYRLGGLTTGRYFVCATSRRPRYPVGGGSAAVYGESCFPGPVSDGAESGLQIEGGQEARANFTLSLMTGAHVRGTVAGAPQSQGPNAPSVQMIKMDAGGRIDIAVQRQRVRGVKFDFPNLLPGYWLLRADGSVPDKVLTANTFIDVGSTDLEGISLVLQPAAPVSGTVLIEDVARPTAQTVGQPTVKTTGQTTDQPQQDTSGKPPVSVNLNPVGIGGPGGRIQWDSEHKSFVFPDVGAGKYRINVNAAGGGYFVKSARLHDQDVRNQDFTVDGATGPIEIVVSNDRGTLQGTVTDTDGNPAASGIVLQCGEVPVILGRSQDDGTISVPSLPAGTCKAWAFDDMTNVEYADEDWMRRYAESATEVTIISGSAAQVSLVRRTAPK